MKFLAISLPRHLSPWPKKAPTITGRGKLKQRGVRGLNSALPALPTKAEHPLVALPLFGDLLVSAKDLFVEATSPTIQGRLAADPKKAHPRISTTSGMPNAMAAHISSVAHGTSAWDLISL